MFGDPFHEPEMADDEGLVGIGGDLRPARLIRAYRRGIFPFFDETTPILWWSPDPRAVFELDALRISRRLARTIRSGKFTVTMNRDFGGVIHGCADRPGHGVWITPAMIEAYTALHRASFAHSVEVWHEGKLAGGLYGVAIQGLFAGESMFTRVTDASKVALAFVMARLQTRGYQLFDVQYLNDHTKGLGATEIPRPEYLRRLRSALKVGCSFV
jgi:leucyl/phenylalanyl-tRNA--protein transferase